MLIGLIIISVILVFIILKAILKFSLKLISIMIFSIVIVLTIGICINKPDIHKPFSLNVIEYLIKINSDGSVSTTKQTTTTVIKGEK